MAKGVGGDFYYINNYEDCRWMICVCDVSGKGISASLLTTCISGITSIYDFKKGLQDYIIKLNDYIFNSFEAERFVTGIFIDFNEETGDLKVLDMGHSYIYIEKKEQLFRLKTKGENVPIGITRPVIPVESRVKLKKGERLFLITDGIIEQTNSAGEEFGEWRFANIVRIINHAVSIKELKNKILSDIYKYRGSQTQTDDMTVVILDYFPS